MKTIEATVEAFRKAIIASDTILLNDLLADELSYGHSDGHVEGKSEFISKIGDGTYCFLTMELSAQEIIETGNTMIVRHTLDARTNDEGKPNEAHLYVLLVWNKYENGWKLIARQAVKKIG
jgi:ketosteroid isomerase-like protein